MTDSEWRAVIEARLANLERMCSVERDWGGERAAVAKVRRAAQGLRLAPAAGDVRDHLLQGFTRDPEAKA